MSAHHCTQHNKGCFRCELSRDEAVSQEIEDAVRPHARRLAEESPATTFLYVGSGYALVKQRT